MKEPQPIERDYQEDKSHENGNYVSSCNKCGFHFVGHKRRVTCKICVTPESKYLQQLEDGEDTRTPHDEYLDAIIDNRKRNGVSPFDKEQPEKEVDDVQKVIGDTSFIKLQDGSIQVATKNGYIELYPDEIKELAAFVQPEKEIETIEQAAEILYTTKDVNISAGKLVLNNNKKEGFIAGANHIKQNDILHHLTDEELLSAMETYHRDRVKGYVPIEEVIKTINNFFDDSTTSSNAVAFLIKDIRNLIKPQ